MKSLFETDVAPRLLLLGACSLVLLAPASASSGPEAGPTVIRREELPFVAVFEDAAGPVREVAVAGVASYSAAELLRFAIAHERESLGRSTVAGMTVIRVSRPLGSGAAAAILPRATLSRRAAPAVAGWPAPCARAPWAGLRAAP